MVLIVSHISGQRRTWCLQNHRHTAAEILEALLQREGNAEDVVLQLKGAILSPSSVIEEDDVVTASLRLPGGKGGFGSMLRAIGAQIEKTTNREACRDLSGRRLRDINEEKRLKDFISKKAERERELLERKRQKYEKLKDQPKHIFQDESYYQQREVREKNLFDSLDKAFSQAEPGTSGTKRKSEPQPAIKKKKGRFLDDLDESSEDDSDSDSESSEKVEKTSSSDEGCNSDSKDEDESGKEQQDEGEKCKTTEASEVEEDKAKESAKMESDAGYSSTKEGDGNDASEDDMTEKK